MNRLVRTVLARFAASSLVPPTRLPDHIPNAEQPLLFTRSDGIEIVGGLWENLSTSTPVPAVSFGVRGSNPGGDGYLHLILDANEPGTFWVGQVIINPKLRRMGLATDLYRQAAKWLKARGGKLRQGWLTSQAAIQMWKKWEENGLAKGKYLDLSKW
jgi:hypothetical protein